MSPLNVFLQLAHTLEQKPFSFFDPEEQTGLLETIRSAIQKLKDILQMNQLHQTRAYRIIGHLEEAATTGALDEVAFLQHLTALIEVYRLTVEKPSQKKLIEALYQQLMLTKPKILEYHIALEVLENKAKQMTDEEKQQSDIKTLQTIGVFYILEYTLYILYKLSQLGESDRKKIFYEGLKTAEANLPPYTSFAESFRRDLCLKIFDPQLRGQLLKIFFHFEEIFRGGEMQQICTAFQQFNLELLRCFKDQGILQFTAAILSPFGKNVPMEELISKVEDLKI